MSELDSEPASQPSPGWVSLAVVVPTTVRVEAGWDRAAGRSATAHRLRIADDALQNRSPDRQDRQDTKATGTAVADRVGRATERSRPVDCVPLGTINDRRETAPSSIRTSSEGDEGHNVSCAAYAVTSTISRLRSYAEAEP